MKNVILMRNVQATQIPVCQVFAIVDQMRNALEGQIPAMQGLVVVDTMKNAQKLTFAYLVNAEVCNCKSLKALSYQ